MIDDASLPPQPVPDSLDVLPPSDTPLADTPPPAHNPREKTRGGGRPGLHPIGTPLKLVSEVGDETLDLKAVHDAIAILLVRYHQKMLIR